MGLVTLVCPKCNGKLNAEEGQNLFKCPFCGTEFIRENKIVNSVTNTVQHIQTQVNIGATAERFENEKNQCRVLIMLLNKLDFAPLKERALRVLDINPENALALMVYNGDFSVEVVSGDVFFAGFDEEQIVKYLEYYNGVIDAELSSIFVKLLQIHPTSADMASKCMNLIMTNLSALNLPTDKLDRIFFDIVRNMTDDAFLTYLKSVKTLSTVNIVTGLLNLGGDTQEGWQGRKNAIALANSVMQSRVAMAKVMQKFIEKSYIPNEDKNKLISRLRRITANELYGGQTASEQNSGADAEKGGMSPWAKAVIAIVIIVFAIIVFAVILAS